MPTFMDLPEHVRETIYGLHLTKSEVINANDHRSNCRAGVNTWSPQMPPLLRVSDAIDQEAAPFYFSKNTFGTKRNGESLYTLFSVIEPRHLKLIRRVSVIWNESSTGAGYGFQTLRRVKGLEELSLGVDEKAMVKRMLRGRSRHKRSTWDNSDPTPQQNRLIMQFAGMPALLRLGPIPKVHFTQCLASWAQNGLKRGGAIPGGVLQTEVGPMLMGRVKIPVPPQAESRETHFSFLSLSPELRNRIYDILLCFEGPVQPRSRRALPPATKAAKKETALQQSVLGILVVNRQIHDEAVGIFYHCNNLAFEWTTHLHCFLSSLSTKRLDAIREITLHHADVKSGGISMVEITYPLLKQLKGLRKLEVLMQGELGHKVNKRWYFATTGTMSKANPAKIPGLPILSELRGVTDIKVRDTFLEDKVEEAKKHDRYPDFDKGSLNACYLQVAKALEHFNRALVAAQDGKICREVLDNDMWHMKDEAEFPKVTA